jgi:CRP/FNR family transcriptional regulator, cyclic AMP receptor protein
MGIRCTAQANVATMMAGQQVAPVANTGQNADMAIDIAALEKIPLFNSLRPEQLKMILGITVERSVAPSEHLCREGDPATSLFFLVQGKVRVSKQIPGVGEEALAILEPGDYFGEMALIDDSPRSADAITNTPCVLGVIDKGAFDQLLFMNKDLAFDLLWVFVRTLSERLRENNEKLRAFMTMASFG